MPDTYSITIHNASNNPEEFFLFHAVPKPAEIPSPDIFSNVYLKSPQILGDGTSSVTFQTSNEYYAIYGTSVQSTDGKVRVGTSDYQPVKLGPHGSYFVLKAAEDGLSPQRDQAASAGKTTEVPGAFTIETDSSFRYPNPSNSYFGIGAKDPSTDEVVPVQTYPAKPAEVSQLFPKPKYYIASGSNQPGSIIETMKIGNVLLVDFEYAVTRVYDPVPRDKYTPQPILAQRYAQEQDIWAQQPTGAHRRHHGDHHDGRTRVPMENGLVRKD